MSFWNSSNVAIFFIQVRNFGNHSTICILHQIKSKKKLKIFDEFNMFFEKKAQNAPQIR